MASYTKLRYHIVTATANREPLITRAVEQVLRSVLYEKARESGSRVLACGATSDHVHVVVAAPPRLALSDLVRALKAASSRAINRSNLLDRPFRWQPRYDAFTADPAHLEPLILYVRNQKQHHAEHNLRSSWEQTTK